MIVETIWVRRKIPKAVAGRFIGRVIFFSSVNLKSVAKKIMVAAKYTKSIFGTS